jgi:hypothetical protein
MNLKQHTNRITNVSKVERIASNMCLIGYLSDRPLVVATRVTAGIPVLEFLLAMFTGNGNIVVNGVTMNRAAVRAAIPAAIEAMGLSEVVGLLVCGHHRLAAAVLCHVFGQPVRLAWRGDDSINSEREAHLVAIRDNMSHMLATAATYTDTLLLCIGDEEGGKKVTSGDIPEVPRGQQQKIIGIIMCRRIFKIEDETAVEMMKLKNDTPAKLSKLNSKAEFESGLEAALAGEGVKADKALSSKKIKALIPACGDNAMLVELLKAIATGDETAAKSVLINA